MSRSLDSREGLPGEPGQPGEHGGGAGGQGGRGGRGGGGRIRYGPLYGYMIASIIFTALLYALLFNVRADNIHNCEAGNDFRTEVNKRASVINELVAIQIPEQRAAEQKGVHDPAYQVIPGEQTTHLHYVSEVPLRDCEGDFPPPWPFG